jgi:hypothetical protein
LAEDPLDCGYELLPVAEYPSQGDDVIKGKSPATKDPYPCTPNLEGFNDHLEVEEGDEPYDVEEKEHE